MSNFRHSNKKKEQISNKIHDLRLWIYVSYIQNDLNSIENITKLPYDWILFTYWKKISSETKKNLTIT